MPDLYQVRIHSIHDKCLTCHVTELYGESYDLVVSRTLAFGFLWDTIQKFKWGDMQPGAHELTMEALQDAANSTPLGHELSHRDFCDDEDWNRANAGRFVSCVSVIDRVNVVPKHDEDIPLEERPRATYLIAVTDPRWLEHLAPGMEWSSRAWDHDRHLVCQPVWRTSDVKFLAKSIDESQDFSGMPILADALQDAGCDSADILDHLRDPHAAHVCGCWALDLILGKE